MRCSTDKREDGFFGVMDVTAGSDHDGEWVSGEVSPAAGRREWLVGTAGIFA